MLKSTLLVHLEKEKPSVNTLFYRGLSKKLCTRGRGRTGTPVKELVFETSASTDSATRAFGMPFGTAKLLRFFEIKAFFFDFVRIFK